MQSPARELKAWKCATAFADKTEEGRVEGITQEDTPSQLLCLLLRYLRRGAIRQHIASVTLRICIGNLLALNLVAKAGEETPLHHAQYFIAADGFADDVQALDELAQNTQQFQVPTCFLLAGLQ